MAPPALNAIDADLAALEAKLRALEEDENSYSDASEASSSASDDSRARKRAKKEAKSAKKDKKRAKKKHKKSTRDAGGDDEPMIIVGGEDLERIAPLPKSLLPEGNDYRGKGASFLGKRGTGASGASASAKANATSSAPESGSNPPSALPETELARRLAARAARPRCDACDMDFTSDAQYVEHCRGKKHAKAIRGPVDAAPRAPRAVKPPPGPHCALCRKIFTSDAQRVEHEGGKWHRQRVAGTLPPSNKPYA